MIEGLLIKTAKPVIDVLVKDIITRKVKQFEKNCKLKYNELLIPRENHFIEYLDRAYDKYSIINTLVFNNSQRQFKELYVPQTIVKDVYLVDDKEPIKIDGFPVSLMKKYKKILISDTVGMGKSTIMKRMFLDLIEQGLKDVGIPIYIELNRLNKNNTILNQIQKELNSLSEEFDNDLLLRFIQTGGFVFFLDGYDEINADKIEVTQNIKDFISKAGTKNYYILSSRPEEILASFGDFLSFKIQSLTTDEAFELLKKYDLSKDKEVSQNLIKTLKTGNYNSIDEYLKNPLMVSLLFTAYNHKHIIPLKKHRFYRQVFDALYDAHKLVQGVEPHKKVSGLDIDDFSRVLKYVGYECLIKIGVQFDKDKILKSINRAKDYYGNLQFSNSDFLNDLLTSVPLFIKDGTGYKWTHKSLMEYFAARFIADEVKQSQDIILSEIYKSVNFEKYVDMLDLYFDIDYKNFSKHITLPACEEFVEFYNNNLFKSSNLDHELIDKRISCLYCGKLTAFVLLKKAREGFSNAIDLACQIFHEQLGAECNDGSVRYVPPTNNFISCLYISDMDYINRILLVRSLLNRKIPKLFKDWSLNMRPLIKHLEFDKAYLLNAKVGEEDKLVYKDINTVLYNSSPYVLDYKSCKTEIDNIKKYLSKYENNSDLLIGI